MKLNLSKRGFYSCGISGKGGSLSRSEKQYLCMALGEKQLEDSMHVAVRLSTLRSAFCSINLCTHLCTEGTQTNKLEKQMDYDTTFMLTSISEKDLDEAKFVGKEIQDLVKTLKDKSGGEVQLMKDMAQLVAFVAVRGTNLTKLQDRTSPEGKRKLAALVQRYGIVAHAKTVPMKTPTLPRIVGLFPALTAAIRFNHPTKVQDVGASLVVPKQYWFPSAGALIADDSLGDWLGWYESFCKVVGIPYDENTAKLGNKFSQVPSEDRVSFK